MSTFLSLCSLNQLEHSVTVLKNPYICDTGYSNILLTRAIYLTSDRAPPRPPMPRDLAPPRPPPPETDTEDEEAFPTPQANQPIMVRYRKNNRLLEGYTFEANLQNSTGKSDGSEYILMNFMAVK